MALGRSTGAPSGDPSVGSGYVLTESARAIITVLVQEGATTRPELGIKLGLSKPTVSAAINELSAYALVREVGRSYGTTGRSAVVYGLGPAMGHVFGVDIGRTHVSIVAQALDGRALGEVQAPIGGSRDGADALRVARKLALQLGTQLAPEDGPLRAAAIAVPTTVSPSHVGTVPLGVYWSAVEDLAPHVPLLVENNVNCAAIAELYHGVAAGRPTFAYLQVGLKIGVGLVVDRRLIRGATGSAGEVSNIPFPWAPGSASEVKALERYLGAEALVERAAARWRADDGPPPHDAATLFARADAGSATARAVIEEQAHDVGRLAATLAAVLDPGLIVLGGGVGQNPRLLAGVQETVRRLTWETEIAVSVLGPRATALGAAQIAATIGLQTIVGPNHGHGLAFSPSPSLLHLPASRDAAEAAAGMRRA